VPGGARRGDRGLGAPGGPAGRAPLEEGRRPREVGPGVREDGVLPGLARGQVRQGHGEEDQRRVKGICANLFPNRLPNPLSQSPSPAFFSL
jgi:hypothetical protein